MQSLDKVAPALIEVQKSDISLALGGTCGVPIAKAICENVSMPVLLKSFFKLTSSSSHLFWNTDFDSVSNVTHRRLRLSLKHEHFVQRPGIIQVKTREITCAKMTKIGRFIHDGINILGCPRKLVKRLGSVGYNPNIRSFLSRAKNPFSNHWP